jgi:hypothetical protein
MEAMAAPDPGLDDPARARIAWGHFRRMMRWMALVAVLAIAAALAYLASGGGPLTIHMVIATILGVGATVMLGTGLMLLVFMSSGSGHDAAVAERRPPEPKRWW